MKRGIYKVWPDTSRNNLPNIKYRSFRPGAVAKVIKCRSQREAKIYLHFLNRIGFVTI